jgi:hypothetical protein
MRADFQDAMLDLENLAVPKIFHEQKLNSQKRTSWARLIESRGAIQVCRVDKVIQRPETSRLQNIHRFNWDREHGEDCRL